MCILLGWKALCSRAATFWRSSPWEGALCASMGLAWPRTWTRLSAKLARSSFFLCFGFVPFLTGSCSLEHSAFSYLQNPASQKVQSCFPALVASPSGCQKLHWDPFLHPPGFSRKVHLSLVNGLQGLHTALKHFCVALRLGSKRHFFSNPDT